MMAENLDDGEFWLPPKFLSDDDLLMEFGKIKEKSRGDDGVKFTGGNNGGFEFGYGFGLSRPNSDLSSGGESVVGSIETESDEDDYVFGLSRKFAQANISDDLWKVENGFGFENKKWSSNLATSPQSTLCNVLGGCDCKQGSSRGSPNCHSPPQTVAVGENPAWGLLYAAAGEVAKLRELEEAISFEKYSSKVAHFGAPGKPSPIFIPAKNTGNLNINQSLSYQQLQAKQFQELKQQQIMKQQQQDALRWGQQQMVQSRARNVNNGRPLGLSPSAWPTLQQSQQLQLPQKQQQPGSGMRAVFLGNPGVKPESSGTGVFLPRRAGTATETLKKQGCSTVLLPDRVVQALNLNLNLKAMDAAASQLQDRSNSNSAGLWSDYDAAIRYRNSLLMAEAQAQQRRNAAIRPQPVPLTGELRLPQEWTY